MAIRKVGSFRLDTEILNAYGNGGFAGKSAIDSGTPSGGVTLAYDGVVFIGICTQAKVEPGIADLVFRGVIGNYPYEFVVTIDANNQRVQGVLEPLDLTASIPVDTPPPSLLVYADNSDLTKSWEYIRVLVQ